jgi:hypothetical protein
MIISCNRIIFPQLIEEDDEILRDAKLRQASKNIRKRKITFHLADVEKFSEHEDSRFIMIWFFTNEPIVIEYDYKVLEEQFRKLYEESDEEQHQFFWIPLN